MSKTALTSSPKKASRHFDRDAWASGYCNVEKELNNFSLKANRGNIPQELCGTFYRNGPGRFERNGQRVHHPFDGDGMITSIRFKNGEATLSNKFVQNNTKNYHNN